MNTLIKFAIIHENGVSVDSVETVQQSLQRIQREVLEKHQVNIVWFVPYSVAEENGIEILSSFEACFTYGGDSKSVLTKDGRKRIGTNIYLPGWQDPAQIKERLDIALALIQIRVRKGW